MFFIEKIRRWKENRDAKAHLALLEKKKKALSATRFLAFFSFILGLIGTALLSGIIYIAVSSDIKTIQSANDTLSKGMLFFMGADSSIYLLLLISITYTLFMTIKGGWIFLKFLFVSSENYDLENEPNFRF